MKFRQLKLLFSIILFLLIAVCAWPAYVGASIGTSVFLETLGFLDFLDLRPKRLWLEDFIIGWRQSAPIAATLGLVAVIDMQLLTRQRITALIAGIFLPITTVGIGLWFFNDYGLEILPTFAATGLILWVLYRLSELISRFEF